MEVGEVLGKIPVFGPAESGLQWVWWELRPEQGGEKGEGPEEVLEVEPVDWQVALIGADE